MLSRFSDLENTLALMDELRRRLSTATDRLRITVLPITAGNTSDSPPMTILSDSTELVPVYPAAPASDDDVVDAVIVDDNV